MGAALDDQGAPGEEEDRDEAASQRQKLIVSGGTCVVAARPATIVPAQHGATKSRMAKAAVRPGRAASIRAKREGPDTGAILSSPAGRADRL